MSEGVQNKEHTFVISKCHRSEGVLESSMEGFEGSEGVPERSMAAPRGSKGALGRSQMTPREPQEPNWSKP